MFVPAMTSRSADYAVFGQSAMLAGAITTAFCDAVGPWGKARSCFIGRDGWNPNPKKNHHIALLEAGPYHDVFPGIFRPGASSFGTLGEKEQAVVIADVDPQYMAEGKPRPQSLSNPLLLVAHLPIIETMTLENRERFERGRPAPAVKEELAQILESLLKAMDNQKTEPMQLAKVLKALAEHATDDGWIKKRAEAWEQNHRAMPWKSPPLPTAVDWLWVDLDVDGLTNNKQIKKSEF
jgi:hypothetical protein